VPQADLSSTIAATINAYRRHGNVGAIMDDLRRIAAAAEPSELRVAIAEYSSLPEVVIPVYEVLTRRDPRDAQALVVLANAYWMTGRGTDVVGSLARQAIDADQGNRGAWHLWALSESDPRQRMERWQEVTVRFPTDQLARAALADNAASVAGAEHDPLALDLAIRTFEGLLAESIDPAQSAALVETLSKLRAWVV
jgi:hypothetical protein